MRQRSLASYWFVPATQLKGIAHTLLAALGAHGVCIAAGGLGVAALVSSALTGAVSTKFIGLAFLVVFSSYRIDYLTERLETQRLLNVMVTLGSFLAAFIVLLQTSRAAALYATLFPVATFFYARPLLPIWSKAIKDLPLFKAIFTAVCWAGLVPFGMFYFNTWNVETGLWLGGFIFLRMFINAVACDFKDMEADARRGTLTFPLWLGESQTIRLLQVMNVAASSVIALVVVCDLAPRSFLWLCLSAVWPTAYLWAIKRRSVGPVGPVGLHGSHGSHGSGDLIFLSATVVDVEFLFWIPLLAIAT